MNTGIYATIDTLAEVEDASPKMGRLVLVSQFTKALIRYGNFAEYRLYGSHAQEMELTQAKLEGLLADKQLDRVSLNMLPSLPIDMSQQDFSILHVSAGWLDTAALAYLRNGFAAKAFPVTSLIHSLNDPHSYLRILKLILSDLKPYDAIICSSEAGRKVMQNYIHAVQENLDVKINSSFTGQLVKIPLGAEPEIFQQQDKQLCRKQLNLPQSATILLHVGRMAAHDKWDPLVILYCFRSLLKQRPDANLYLVLAGGIDQENARLYASACAELQITERVIFKTNFSDAEKPLLYSSADIFFSLSDNLQETFGIAVVEAMLAGLPVIVADFDGYKELVAHEKTGLRIPTFSAPMEGIITPVAALLDPNVYKLLLAQSLVIDMPALEQAFLALLDSPHLRQQLGEAACRYAKTNFGWKNVIAQYEQLWQELQKQAAKDGSVPSETATDPFAIDFHHCFQHYPTAHVGYAWQVSLANRGKELLQNKEIPFMYKHLKIFISLEWLQQILERLLKGSASVNEIMQHLKQIAPIPEENILFHLLWLAKYDIVKLEPESSK